MNIYGVPIEGDNLSNGGTVSGDLAITKDLTVSGDTSLQDFTAVNGNITGELQVATLVSDIKTEDTLIHLGVNNVADNLNLGIIEEYTSGGLKYSGLVRDRTDKKQYVIEGVTPIPTGITNIAAEPRGNLVCNNFESKLITTDDVAAVNSVNSKSFGVADAGLVNRHSIEVGVFDLQIKNQAGDVNMTISQAGVVSIPRNNLSLGGNDIIDTDAITCNNQVTNFSNFCQSLVLRDPTLTDKATLDISASPNFDIQIKDAGGTPIISISQAGEMKMLTSGIDMNDKEIKKAFEIRSKNFYLNDSITDVWRLSFEPGDDFSMRNAAGDLKLSMTQGGDMTLTNDIIASSGIFSRNQTTISNDFGGSFIIRKHFADIAGGVGYVGTKARGTLAAPTAVLLDDTLTNFRSSGYDGTSEKIGAEIRAFASENWSVGNNGTCFEISTTDNGTSGATTKMFIDSEVRLDTQLNMKSNDIINVGEITNTTIKTTNLEIGTSPNEYTFPTGIGAGVEGSILKLRNNALNFDYPGFSQRATYAVPTASTAEHTITIGPYLGSTTMAANTIITGGESFHLIVKGEFRNQNASADLTFRVKLNGTVVAEKLFNLDAVASLSWFEIETDLTFHTAGVSVTPNCSCQFNYLDSGTYKGDATDSLFNPIDTTVSNTWSASIQWATNSIDNQMFVRQVRLTKEL